jgi:hypothetical protein
MIRYALSCDQDHTFEAWFGASSDYDDQAARGLVECPFCASRNIRKQIMAPAVAGTKSQKSGAPAVPEGASPEVQTMMMEVMHKVRDYVETNFEHVGDRFAREARDIHEGAAEARPIYGEATPKEVRELAEDGIAVAPLPMPVKPKTQMN